ncbi:S41 family peptidase [Pontimicrobium aquaticum]|nr:S41 family peptidase [Pontimicrobium aquaticum]
MKRITKILFLLAIGTNLVLNAQSINKIENAMKLYQNEQWQEAAVAFSTIIEDNIYNGEYYYNLAHCFYKLKDYDKAIKNYKLSLDTGYNYGNCIKHIAMCYAESGDLKNTSIWINRGLKTPKSLSITNVVSDSAFKEFRKTDSYKSIYSQDSTFNREEKWKTDIKFLKHRFEVKHYDIFNTVKSKEWNSDFNLLLESVNQKTDAEILVSLMKITTKIGDGHTFIRPPLSGKFKLHFYPFKLYMFEKGLYVTQTSSIYKDALGLRLTHINSMSIKEVLEKIKDVISVDNEIGLFERLDFNLMFSEVLHVLNITSNPKSSFFTFQKEDGSKITIDVNADEFNPAILTEKLESHKTKIPLYQQNENDFFWSKELNDFNAMYVKININLSTPQQSIKQFYDKVFDSISKQNIKHLIIDLRHCPGGNSFNNKTLIKHIIANKTLDKENGIFTIIGRRTFSAAMNLSTDLETWTNTKFIGEPTGSKPNFIGETNFVTLPNTGIQLSISDAYWQQSVSWDKRNWIAPHIYVQNNFNDFKNGNDNILNTIKTIVMEKMQID